MVRIPTEPPVIAPLPDGVDRPQWSVMIPVYNCSQYIEKTLRSVLDQAPGPEKMQIEVVDDCSTDADVGALVQRVGEGRVGYTRKEQNMGSLRNFETCINRAKGHYLHLLHGDDFVKPGFYTEMEALLNQYPDAGAAFCDFIFVNEHSEELYTEKPLMTHAGPIENALLVLGSMQRIQTPAMVVKRSTYEQLGSFYAVKYGEDWEMWVRIASKFPMLHSPKHLACYRLHSSNITGQSLTTGQNIKDINTVMRLIQQHLPAAERGRIMKNARFHFSIYYAWMAHKLYAEHPDRKAALAQIEGALKMSKNRTTLLLAAKLYAKVLLRYKSIVA
jgi:glycosyltransferase involved in cell wall biosynthesis